MKLKLFSKRKETPHIEVSRPKALSEPTPTAPAPIRDRAERQLKHMAVTLGDSDAAILRQSISQGNSPPQSASLASSMRRPSNNSSVSLAAPLYLQERRSSTRSLALLMDLEESGQLPVRVSPPPVPNLGNLALLKKFYQWGNEAGTAQDKAQRAIVMPQLTAASQQAATDLHIDGATAISDLPKAIAEMQHLRTLRFSNLRQVSQYLDLRDLIHLTQVDVVGCPHLRLQTRSSCKVTIDGVSAGADAASTTAPLLINAPQPVKQEKKSRFWRS